MKKETVQSLVVAGLAFTVMAGAHAAYAQLDDVDCDSLAAAIVAAGNAPNPNKPNTHVMTGDCDLGSDSLPVVFGNISIVGNGHSVDGNGSSRSESLFIVENGGQLTLNNVIVTNGSTTINGGGIWVQPNGMLIMNGGEISYNEASLHGGGFINFGTTTLNEVTVAGNEAFIGGGIFNDGNLTLNNVKVSKNLSDSNAGGIHHNENTLAVNGGEIRDNTAFSSGGGLYIQFGTVTSLNGVTISGNDAKSAGGMYLVASVTMNGGEIRGNTAKGSGGGVLMVADNASFLGTLIMNQKAQISGNTAEVGNGGGVYMTGPSQLTLNGRSAIFDNNGFNGKDVYVQSDGTIVVAKKAEIENCFDASGPDDACDF